MFGALKRGRFRSLASLILVVNVVSVGELRRKRTLAASRGFLAAARLSCSKLTLNNITFAHNITCSFIIDKTHLHNRGLIAIFMKLSVYKVGYIIVGRKNAFVSSASQFITMVVRVTANVKHDFHYVGHD